MALEVTTIDSVALGDAELAELADLCAEAGFPHEVGTLSKLRDNPDWVLVSRVREGNHLRGFSVSSLVRLGGTPSIVYALAVVKRSSRRDAILKSIITENFRRALAAFPDEDILVGARFSDPGATEAFKAVVDIVPRPGHKASGEERAWGKRLARRYEVSASAYDEVSFTVTGDGSLPMVVDHETSKPASIPADIAAQFDHLDADRGDHLILCGWVMAEDLLKYG
jgi:hypothetical protein